MRKRTLMCLDNTLCVEVDRFGHISSIRGYHGHSTTGKNEDIRRIVADNPRHPNKSPLRGVLP